jgi:hypothetical protein
MGDVSFRSLGQGSHHLEQCGLSRTGWSHNQDYLTTKYCNDFVTIDHRYCYVPFTCLALHYEEMSCLFAYCPPSFCLQRGGCVSYIKGANDFPCKVKNLNEPCR